MKHITSFLLLLICITSTAQKLKDELKGDWVCTQILDTQGKPTPGKFGQSNEYLRFSFSKNYLTIAEAPFDQGSNIPVAYGVDSFEQAPGSLIAIPEKKYTVVSVDSSTLILQTISKSNERIEYHFINQRSLGRKLPTENITADFGKIIIKHIRNKADPSARVQVTGTSKVFEYRISNATENLYPCPLFTYPASPTLASGLSYNLKFPASITPGETTTDLVIAFDVSTKGAEKFRVVQGINPELDVQVINYLNQYRKHWEMPLLNNKPVSATVTLHFGFILIEE